MLNAAVLVDEHGRVLAVYTKKKLVPFAELVPGGSAMPGLATYFPEARGTTTGNDRFSRPVRFDGRAMSLFICYEILFPELVRSAVGDDSSELIINVSSDSWFADSLEPWMHFAAAKLRAVENRRYVIRSSNGGISGLVDPWGRVVASSNAHARTIVFDRIAWRHQTSVYQRFGNKPWLVLVLLLGSVIGALRIWPATRSTRAL